jgi:DNA-damage-inducible protein J
MAQQTFSIRMDEKLKKEFDLLVEDMGMNATTAFNIFARAVVREKKIPFEINTTESKKEQTLTKKQLLELLNTMNED